MFVKGPAKGCTPVEMTDEDRAYVTKVHNELRSKVARGFETRGLPGPQPTAKNMAKMVRTTSCHYRYWFYKVVKYGVMGN